jgi:hypothetical protein
MWREELVSKTRQRARFEDQIVQFCQTTTVRIEARVSGTLRIEENLEPWSGIGPNLGNVGYGDE